MWRPCAERIKHLNPCVWCKHFKGRRGVERLGWATDGYCRFHGADCDQTDTCDNFKKKYVKKGQKYI